MATVDSVTIGNLALSHLGARSTIESLDESSPQAQQVKLWYDFSREQALSVADWNFARKRQVLGLHADAPSDDWLYRYTYPADCLVARWIENPVGITEDLVPFKVETSEDGTTQTILTNVETAKLVYTFNQTFASLFSPFFIEMLSYLLAHHMAYSITGKTALQEKMLGIYFRFTSLSPAQNANEGVEVAPRDAPSIRGR